jgi:hypothetical protein
MATVDNQSVAPATTDSLVADPSIAAPLDAGAVNVNTPIDVGAAATPPGLPTNADELKPQNGNYNFIAPPAQGFGQFGEIWNDPRDLAASRNKEGEADQPDGTKTDVYSGYLQDGTIGNWFAASYASEETVNAGGEIEHRKIEYSSGGFGLPSISFQSPGDGTTSIDQVKSVETTRNDASGQYATTVTDSLGEQWQAISGPDGVALSFEQISPVHR